MLTNSSGRNVPVEVLGEILGQVVGPIGLHRNRDHFSDSKCHNPWELALVCKNWRDAVFLAPFIWRDISLDIVPETSHKHDALLLALKLCLERSRSHSLIIELIGFDEGNQSDQIPVLLEAVMEHAPRWESVFIRAPLPSTYFPRYPIQYTRLSRIEFGHQVPLSHDSVELFEDAPLLSHVALLRYTKRFYDPPVVKIPWSQITHLRISQKYCLLVHITVILRCTPNLEEFDYLEWSNYDFEMDDDELPIVKLPHLRRLVWESLCREDSDSETEDDQPPPVGPATTMFFKQLIAPRLSELLVRGACSNEDMEAIRDFIQRSRCSIIHLHLPTFRIFPLLGQIPDVKTLVCVNALQNAYEDLDEELDDGNFELVHLEKIVCGQAHLRSNTVLRFFELFQAPKLSGLMVTSINTGVFMVYIRDFLRRSRCSIKTLCITDPDLSFLYDVVLDVETLVLPPDTLQYLTPIIEQLTFDQYTNSWLFPKLKKIELNVDITAGPDSEAFVHMLESRLRSPPDFWAWLGCEKIRELELGCLVQEPMRQWFRMKLQEHMVITWKELSE